MAAFKQKLAGYGIEGYILGPIYMKSKEQVDKAFDYVKRYGIDMFIGVPDYEFLPYVEKKVKETGIKVAIHTHGPDSKAFPNAQEVVDRVKDPNKGIGICLDLGHSVRYGEDNAEILKKYKEWIYDIHFKDESAPTKEGKTWEMGRGVIDYRPILKVLRETGYKGKVCLEFEKNPENPQPGVLESIGYFRGICDGTK
ncbi:sugar phosphate isomerase/epimerase family protein [Gallalistipes aquisgranensis]|uniref:sugar phosphate isomerase/epimerase family protein n=1 Tax=Gallalistipes aquisgranensis TaxID=2779358 RepID=UPI001CF87336|nr:sugar phosphate isomerase/epimerase family protein [Gallalistipes aquisgranensis]MBE5033746.1 sugar phosphate isomerase/epimerase [Gallalistipes aquisgranensis]